MAGAGRTLGEAETGFGRTVMDIGSGVAGARRTDVATLGGIGSDIQRQRQAEFDAQREALEKARTAPMDQYREAKTYIDMIPAGRTDIRTDFTAPPSALQTAIGTGLSAFGGLGSLYGGGGSYQAQPYRQPMYQTQGPQPIAQPQQNNPFQQGAQPASS